MVSDDLIYETLLLSKQGTNEDRESIIKDIEKVMESENNPNVIAFFDWYISVLKELE